MNQSFTKLPFSPTNTSKAKMLYSFSKTKRFFDPVYSPSQKKIRCEKFYDLPPIFGDSPKAGMGYGKKTQMFDKDNITTPPPNNYNIKSIFEDCKKGYGFGVGRQNLKIGGIFNNSDLPGPGSYMLTKKNSSPQFTLKSRLKQTSFSNRNNPGPGAYNLPKYINQQGKYNLSQLKNSMVPSFKQYKSVKSMKKIPIPGPGSYELKQNFSPHGKYFNSKYPNSMTRTFGKVERKIFDEKNITVGPGSYHFTSQFGNSQI